MHGLSCIRLGDHTHAGNSRGGTMTLAQGHILSLCPCLACSCATADGCILVNLALLRVQRHGPYTTATAHFLGGVTTQLGYARLYKATECAALS